MARRALVNGAAVNGRRLRHPASRPDASPGVGVRSVLKDKVAPFSYFLGYTDRGPGVTMKAGLGPTLPTLAMQQLGGYLRQTGRDADVGVKAYIDRKSCGDFMIS
jgi:hypothetical protein